MVQGVLKACLQSRKLLSVVNISHLYNGESYRRGREWLV